MSRIDIEVARKIAELTDAPQSILDIYDTMLEVWDILDEPIQTKQTQQETS